jgi:homocitrate synthase NifV
MRAASRKLSPDKPIVGSQIFNHESGLHVDGILKSVDNYEPYPPATVAANRQIIIGKHSGRSALEYKLRLLGLPANKATLGTLLTKVRAQAITQKRPLQDQELITLYNAQNPVAPL